MNGITRSPTRTALLPLLALTALTALGCGGRSEVDHGSYVAYQVYGHDEAEEELLLATTLDVDRDAERVTLTLHDGTQLSSTFTARPRSDWPSGCPTMHGATDMEILVLDEKPIVIESLEFMEPVIVASCPANAVDVVLTEDIGAAAFGGVPCSSTETCLWFRPDGT